MSEAPNNDVPDELIRLAEVRKIYKRGLEEVHALSGLDVRLDRGEYVAIMGPSGSANRR